jgi:hypothetical protein
LLLALTVLVFSCKKGEKKANLSPETQIVPHEINLQGDNRLGSTVKLSWFGSDQDGFITGYEYSFDEINWNFTRTTDTTFSFTIDQGSDTLDVEIFVRAIDNQNLKDPSPAKLVIPVKNSPPSILFDELLSSKDTTHLITTLQWIASDPDGVENIKSIELKINSGDWYALDKKQKRLDLVPENATTIGATDAFVHYLPLNAASQKIAGLKLGDTNTFYIKATDIANSESNIDTLTGVYVKEKKNDLLVIGGDITNNAFYVNRLSNVVNNFDFIDYISNGQQAQPVSWNNSFYLLISQYPKLFIFSDYQEYVNQETGLQQTILELSAPSVLVYNTNGGKVFTIGFFKNPLSTTSPIYETYPLESVDSASAGLFLQRSDTTLKSQFAGYPDLGTNQFPSEFSPFQEKSSPSIKVIYTAVVDNTSGYTGPVTVGIKKEDAQGKTNMVFITAAMPPLNKDYTKVDSLFHQVLNQEFQ